MLSQLYVVLQAANFGPSVAYVDDAAAMEAQLKDLLPSLKHVLADVLHIMKRVFETLSPQHPKIGELQHCSVAYHPASQNACQPHHCTRRLHSQPSWTGSCRYSKADLPALSICHLPLALCMCC